MKVKICELCKQPIDDINDARIEWGHDGSLNGKPYAHICHKKCSKGYNNDTFVMGDIFLDNSLSIQDIEYALNLHKKSSTNMKAEFGPHFDKIVEYLKEE